MTHNPDIECYADRLIYLADGVFKRQALNRIQRRLIYDEYIGANTCKSLRGINKCPVHAQRT